MKKDKAVWFGLIAGGFLGFATAGSFLLPLLPVTGAGLAIACIIGGAFTGGFAAATIADEYNLRHPAVN